MAKSKKVNKQEKQVVSFPRRVVVRFREGVQIPEAGRPEDHLEKLGIGPWRKLLKQFPGLKLTPAIMVMKRAQLAELVQKAARMDPTYKPVDFSVFYNVEAPLDTDLTALAKAFLEWHTVAEAYVDQLASPPAVNPADDLDSAAQGYLDPAPEGIDAEYAWTLPGGDGAGMRFIDLEQGWTLNHEDIAAHNIPAPLIGGIDNTFRNHGTSVLGVVCAVDNALGCVGIVPNLASVRVVATTGNGATQPNAILAAVNNLGFGDVLLLEAQVYLAGTLNGSPISSLLGPIEAQSLEFNAIQLATALGIVVVEAGGNGNDGGVPAVNLDQYATVLGKAVLHRDPANPDFRDSGAIIVSAASSAAPHLRLAFAPHGKRIDCYAWGEGITTLDSNSAGAINLYTSGFGGTSGASAIIAGAALAVQGRAQLQTGVRFSPRQLRAILSGPTGTAAQVEATPRNIGMMPNLRGIFDNVLNVAPDVYMRDHVGDAGAPHPGAVSSSPDIILRTAQVAIPQTAFGSGSGTEGSETLGSTAEFGQDNYLYVRVLNRGGAPAANVEVNVFWSPPATLITPDMWTPVNAAPVVVPSVPVGLGTTTLTVAPEIVWPSAQIPAVAHYCFVGLIGNAQDPAPNPGSLVDWNIFIRFIRENNNVTWRNFNVVPNVPPPPNVPQPQIDPQPNNPPPQEPPAPDGFVALGFLAPGAPDIARPMALEIVSRLPEGSRLMVEMPIMYYRQLSARYPIGRAKLNDKWRVARVMINPQMGAQFEDVVFPAKSRMKIRLLVQIPRKYLNNAYQVYARQLWEKQEVGRITWQLQPPRKGDGKGPKAKPVLRKNKRAPKK